MHPSQFLSYGALRFIDPSHPFEYGDHNAHRIPSTISSNGWRTLWPCNSRLDERICPPLFQEPHTGALSGGGLRAPGARRADGRTLGPIGGRHPDGTPRFDQAVPPGGYLWWYVDALSDDGQYGLTIIAFVGSVFSPYYYWARARNPNTNPENHCAINVALYGPHARRWTMTERGCQSISRDAHHFQVGPSQLRWTGESLDIDLNEIAVPFAQRVRGTIRLFPNQLFNFTTALDQEAQHHWGPIAPSARVEVNLERPTLSWKGHGYLDSNEGEEPISAAFVEWDWSRANMRDGSVTVLYDIREKSGHEQVLALRFKRDGTIDSFDAPPRQSLPKAFWRVARSIRSQPSFPLRVNQTLEDTPFYIRSVLQSGLLGESILSMHETLNVPKLDRLSTRLMLPWRMPRRP